MNPPSPADDEAVRRLAAEILARPEFDRPRQALEGWQALLQWFEWLRERLDWSGLAQTNPPLFYAILFGLLAVTAALIAHLVWSVRAALTHAVPRRDAPSPPTEPGFAEDADRLARDGRYLEAAHRLQLGVLELLLRGRRLELSRSEPNRVLRRRLAEARLPADERSELVQLLDRFETRWFRDRAEDPALYEAWRRLYQRLAGGGAAA